jgi:ubiquitin C-terminal hydrolase
LSFEASDDSPVDIDIDEPDLLHLPSGCSEQQHELDGRGIRPSSSSTSSFSLVGTVMHTGRTLDSGHYYADVRCNGCWIRVNDTSVQPLEWDPRRLQSPAWSNMAYVQMYSCPSFRSNDLQVLALQQ